MSVSFAADQRSSAVRFIRLGIVAGFVTCIGYPVVSFAPLPHRLAIVLVALLGPALGVASLGLREALRLHERSVAATLGGAFNLLAGALFTAMLLVQLAVRGYALSEALPSRLVGVWLGLDVAWDVYVGIGTIFFSIAMLRHPRFGPWYAAPGLLIAAALLALNLGTFPLPPGEAGLVDVGPLVGLWYLVVTVRMWRSLGWAARQAG